MTKRGATIALLRAGSLLLAVWVMSRAILGALVVRAWQESGVHSYAPSMLQPIAYWGTILSFAALAFLLAARIAQWRGDAEEPATSAHGMRLLALAAGLWLVAGGFAALASWLVALFASDAGAHAGIPIPYEWQTGPWRLWTRIALNLGAGTALILGARGLTAIGRALRAAAYSSGVLLRAPPEE